MEKRTLAGTLSSLSAIILTHPPNTIKVSKSLRIISPEDKWYRDQEYEQLEKGKKRLEEAMKVQKEKEGIEDKIKEEVSKKPEEKEKGRGKEPTLIPNSCAEKHYEPLNIGLTVFKSRKGHMLGVSSIAVSPKKDIFTTSRDDTTWKLWTLPQGDLMMCGEGHQVSV